jgi:hypothetical protein
MRGPVKTIMANILFCVLVAIISPAWVPVARADTATFAASISGPPSVNAGATAAYTVTITTGDEDTPPPVGITHWSVAPARYARINSNGLLTAKSVRVNRTVTIRVRFTSGKTSVTAKKVVTIVAPPYLTALTITGPSSAAAGASTQLSATAVFSDNSTQDVTAQAKWSDNSARASVSSAGVLTTRLSAAGRTVTVKATYKSGALTKSATKRIAITAVPPGVTLTGLTITGPPTVRPNSSNGYTATATFSSGPSQNVTGGATWSLAAASQYASISISGVLTTTAPATSQNVTLRAVYTYGAITRTATLQVTITTSTPPPPGVKSINSTSANSATLPSSAVAEQPLTTRSGFQIFAVNDLGMHCGDLDHRVVSILPPYNVLHAQVIQKGTSSIVPEILTSTDIDVVYSAASNPKDPALQNQPAAPIYKTDFWNDNPAKPGSSLAFDAYDPYYPPGILGTFPLVSDTGLPTPDLDVLYPVSGTGVLSAAQQSMPGKSAPYSANIPQSFVHFEVNVPFFVNFSFGYRVSGMNWFAADGIPMTPYDDFGRNNPFPLMRIQAKTKNATLTGNTGDIVASVDSVLPISGETTCSACHVSSGDGGGGFAACIPSIDANCPTQGSPRSNTPFLVARPADDPSNFPSAVKIEWAADTNILRLHDAKHGTHLQNSTPVSCQTCHYTPALDLANVGPLGPADASANGRDQKVHQTNSRVLHTFHAQFTDLFPNDMPPPNSPLRLDPATGKPVVNAFVQNKLNLTCYRCHPGKVTQCLRGAMAGGGMICQDCHGSMSQVGNDFSAKFSSATPYPTGADLTKRVPWANEPHCQSCHTGDTGSNLTSDPNVIKSTDGVRLLQAYRTNDSTAKPILATNTRFAEETASNANTVLYRMSRGHGGVFCEACHGSTHAEWPVSPSSGTYIANDNMAATQIQGHVGKIIECTACHAAGSLSPSLGGPHGMHPVGDQHFVNGHEDLVGANRAQCRACHGQTGQGSVLSKVAATRTFSTEGGQKTLTAGQQVSCGLCHGNPL